MLLNGNEERSSSPESATCGPAIEVEENQQPKTLLTIKQFALLYGVDQSTILRRNKTKQLVAVKRPGATSRTSPWLIVDPGWNHAINFDTAPHGKHFLVDDIHVLNGIEVGLLLGMSPRGVRKMAEEGRIKFVMGGLEGDSVRRYSITDVRQAMATRLKLSKQEKRPSRRTIRRAVLNWAKGRLNLDKLPGEKLNSST
jgi:hypothetical protein